MPWLQLIFESDAELAPLLADHLHELEAAAVTLEDSADQPLYEPPPGATPLWSATRVVALYPAESDPQTVVAQLEQRLARPLPPWRVEALAEQDWTRAWMDAFEPMRFGERLWIVPSWHQPPEAGGVNILLDPGIAFGTGTHPTTRLCLEWLDANAPEGQRVIDYGCGSGILAIAALKLGAQAVQAVDNDPQALDATRDNAERNRVEERLTTFLPEQLPHEPCDLLLANILAGPLITLALHFALLLRPGGRLVLSGILPEQSKTVAEAYADRFEMEPAVTHDGWVRLQGQRK